MSRRSMRAQVIGKRDGMTEADLWQSRPVFVFCKPQDPDTLPKVRTLRSVQKAVSREISSSERTKRDVALVGGDALRIRSDQLVHLLEFLHTQIPELKRVAVYVSVASVLRQGPLVLESLHKSGVTDASLLEAGKTPGETAAAIRFLAKAGISVVGNSVIEPTCQEPI